MELQPNDQNRRQAIIDPKELEVIVVDDGVYYCKPVPDFDGYFASTCGRVISTKQRKLRVLKPFRKDNDSAYLRIFLGGHTKQLHRVIASAYLFASTAPCRHGRPRNEVNHIDGNPRNNKMANLEIVSAKENAAWNKVMRAAEAEGEAEKIIQLQ